MSLFLIQLFLMTQERVGEVRGPPKEKLGNKKRRVKMIENLQIKMKIITLKILNNLIRHHNIQIDQNSQPLEKVNSLVMFTQTQMLI